MEIREKILKKLCSECNLMGEDARLIYIQMRKKDIITNHINNVCKIYQPGEGGQQRYYFTKLEPKNRKNQKKIYAKTLEELEDKIIAHYLAIEEDKKLTVYKILRLALNLTDDEEFNKLNNATGVRHFQRFRKHLSVLLTKKIANLSEEDINSALTDMIVKKADKNGDLKGITQKEFSQTMSILYKVQDYCLYNHITVINIRETVRLFSQVKLTGKNIFDVPIKPVELLAFNRKETEKIINYALKNKSFQSLAIAFALVTGLRAGELLALELKDIHLDENNGYLWIHQREDNKTEQILQDCKDHSVRRVYISEGVAMEVAKACIEYRNRFKFDSPFLFLNPNDEDNKMHAKALDYFMRRYVHRDILGMDKNVKPRSLHDCRRTYASLEKLNGTDLYTIQRQLGHANSAQTEAYIKDVADAWERLSKLKGIGIDVNNKAFVA